MHTRGNINDLSTNLTFCLPGGQEELPPPFPQSHLSGWNLARSTTVLPPHLPIYKICKTTLANTWYWKCTTGFPTHPRIHPSHSPIRWNEWRLSILFAQPQAHLKVTYGFFGCFLTNKMGWGYLQWEGVGKGRLTFSWCSADRTSFLLL